MCKLHLNVQKRDFCSIDHMSNILNTCILFVNHMSSFYFCHLFISMSPLFFGVNLIMFIFLYVYYLTSVWKFMTCNMSQRFRAVFMLDFMIYKINYYYYFYFFSRLIWNETMSWAKTVRWNVFKFVWIREIRRREIRYKNDRLPKNQTKKWHKIIHKICNMI